MGDRMSCTVFEGKQRLTTPTGIVVSHLLAILVSEFFFLCVLYPFGVLDSAAEEMGSMMQSVPGMLDAFFFAPVFESGLVFLLVWLLAKFQTPAWLTQTVVGLTVGFLAHALFTGIARGTMMFLPFLLYARAYLALRQVNAKRSKLAIVGMHATNNLLVFALATLMA